MITLLELAKMTRFLVEIRHQQYCCLALESAMGVFLPYDGVRSAALAPWEAMHQFYQDYWLPEGGAPFWNKCATPENRENRLNFLALWIAHLEKQEAS